LSRGTNRLEITDKQLELDTVIGMVAKLSANGSEIARLMIGCLSELKDRRESDLIPVTKFTQGMHTLNAISKQFAHVKSEVDEAQHEINSLLACRRFYSRPEYLAALELIDIQTSCESLLHLLGYQEHGRRELRKQVIAKNAERGYYDE